MSKQSVLVVDDEEPLRGFMRRNLEVRGYNVLVAADGLEALAQFDNNTIDLIVLDVMMPKMDGLAVLRQVRETSRIPIIVLSALGEESDKIKALNLGADDYLTKPFGVEEVLARVRAVLRRSNWEKPLEGEKQLEIGDVLIDFERHKVIVREELVEMTPTEFELLAFFIRNRNKLLTHEMILQNVWGSEYGQETEYLRVYVGRLRQKIEADPSQPAYLQTEHGVGYSFSGEVSAKH
ncbi:MAG: response regulator transcription factor [Anaerolineales bacterium]